jgi:hypothetical protein
MPRAWIRPPRVVLRHAGRATGAAQLRTAAGFGVDRASPAISGASATEVIGRASCRWVSTRPGSWLVSAISSCRARVLEEGTKGLRLRLDRRAGLATGGSERLRCDPRQPPLFVPSARLTNQSARPARGPYRGHEAGRSKRISCRARMMSAVEAPWLGRKLAL